MPEKWEQEMKILILGAGGMLGNMLLRVLSENQEWDVWGTIRNSNIKQFFSKNICEQLVHGIDVENPDVLMKILDEIRPNLIINCVGLIKHKSEADDPLVAIPINSIIPHRLARACKLIGARLIHISTDCVFSGKNGYYTEDDLTDACDVYGKSKALGEVYYPHTVTLRTSIIGHELMTKHALLDWFLSQEEVCKGYKQAIFSGMPTIIFAQVIRDVVIPHNELSGLYNVAAKPISKFELLTLIAKVYDKQIAIIADDSLKIDRSLDATRFSKATGYVAPEWEDMIRLMHAYR